MLLNLKQHRREVEMRARGKEQRRTEKDKREGNSSGRLVTTVR